MAPWIKAIGGFIGRHFWQTIVIGILCPLIVAAILQILPGKISGKNIAGVQYTTATTPAISNFSDSLSVRRARVLEIEVTMRSTNVRELLPKCEAACATTPECSRVIQLIDTMCVDSSKVIEEVIFSSPCLNLADAAFKRFRKIFYSTDVKSYMCDFPDAWKYSGLENPAGIINDSKANKLRRYYCQIGYDYINRVVADYNSMTIAMGFMKDLLWEYRANPQKSIEIANIAVKNQVWFIPFDRSADAESIDILRKGFSEKWTNASSFDDFPWSNTNLREQLTRRVKKSRQLENTLQRMLFATIKDYPWRFEGDWDIDGFHCLLDAQNNKTAFLIKLYDSISTIKTLDPDFKVRSRLLREITKVGDTNAYKKIVDWYAKYGKPKTSLEMTIAKLSEIRSRRNN